MAFVQVSKAKNLTEEAFHKLAEAWIGDGLDGLLFAVGGPGQGAFYLVEGWESREDCDAAMVKLTEAVQRLGIEPPEVTEEEFDLDYRRLV
jgi:hypothetical protein